MGFKLCLQNLSGLIIPVILLSAGISYAQPEALRKGLQIRDEGTGLARRNFLNFLGGGVSCADDTTDNETECTVSDPWVDDGAVVRLQTSTDNVSVGTTSAGGKVFIDGDTDEIQLQVQGNATQTTNLVVFENSAGTDQFSVSNTGGIVTSNTITGNWDFGGAGSVEIVNGASPTVDAAGEIAVDTTDDQLNYFGGAKRVIPYRIRKCVMFENLVAADDNMLIWNAEKAITVQAVSCRTSSFTTQPTLTFEDGSGNAMTGNPTCNATETQAWTSITAGGAVTALESIRFDTTNTPAPTTGTQALICFVYDETAS